MRIIRITEAQLREIEDNFSYWDDEKDTHYYDGQKNISVDGKVEDGGENPEENTTSDKIGKMLCPQYRYRGTRTAQAYSGMREGVAIKGNDVNKADDVGEMPSAVKDNKDLNTLTNGKNDDLVRIPQSVIDKIDLALKTINNAKLTPKQTGMVLNKFIEELNTDSVPYQMQRKWKNNIKNGLVKKGLDRSSATELENEAD